jgi:hypothetical protein
LGGIAVGAGLDYLQFSGQCDSPGLAFIKAYEATVITGAYGYAGASAGELAGGFIGALVPGLGETGISEAVLAAIGGAIGGYFGNMIGTCDANALFGW